MARLTLGTQARAGGVGVAGSGLPGLGRAFSRLDNCTVSPWNPTSTMSCLSSPQRAKPYAADCEDKGVPSNAHHPNNPGLPDTGGWGWQSFNFSPRLRRSREGPGLPSPGPDSTSRPLFWSSFHPVRYDGPETISS